MRRICHSRSLAAGLASVTALIGAGIATGATASTASCDARTGRTTLENSSVRLFRLHKHVYACARPSGQLISVPTTQAHSNVAGASYQLAGRFVEAVILTTITGAGPRWTIYVVDTRGGTIRKAGVVRGLHEYLVGSVLNSHGTEAWVDAAIDGARAWVYENTAKGTKQLHEYISSNPVAPGTAVITSLALSTDDHTLYWLDKNTPEQAHIQ